MDYLNLFFPFDKPDVVKRGIESMWNISNDRVMMALAMTMSDKPMAVKLDAFLQFNDADVLQDKGKVTAAIAKAFAESEFEKYRVIQDRLYQSDFDRLIASAEDSE